MPNFIFRGFLVGLRSGILGLILGATGLIWAAGAAEADAKAAKSDPPTHTVKRGAIRSRVPLDAVLESTEMSPVRIPAKAVTEVTVLEAVPHGARVRKGDSLVKIDLEKLREQIEDLELDRPAGVLALELAEAEVANLAQTTPFKLEAAKRAQRNATEDLAYFESVGRASREKGVAFNLKSADQRLEGAREEFNQLKKMYDADDLTEETEEIILKRQKFAVESSEYFVETTKQSAELSLKTTLPREHEALRTAKRDQDVAAAYAEETLGRTLAKKRLDLEKTRRDQKKAEKRLADLKKDLEEMTVTAPMDGLVYYGACEDGKWTTAAALAKRLIPGGKLAAREIFMTVVNPDKLVLRAIAPEAEVGKLKAGLEGQAAPVAAPDRKLPVKLDELGFVPLPGGGFEVRLSLVKPAGVRLVPGMNCKVSLEGGRQANVLLAPKDAVFGEGGEKYVYVAAKGAAQKRPVKTGLSDDQNVEIEAGLEAGDKILTRKPE